MKFNEKVWEKCKEIPVGRVTTYKKLAHSLGTKAYQAVGNALRQNPHAPIVPCHRVVRSDLSIGGFMGETEGKTVARKIALLEKEGVVVENKKVKTESLFRY